MINLPPKCRSWPVILVGVLGGFIVGCCFQFYLKNYAIGVEYGPRISSPTGHLGDVYHPLDDAVEYPAGKAASPSTAVNQPDEPDMDPEELLRRVKKHSARVMPASKLQLDDPYFSPSPVAVESFANPVLRAPTLDCGRPGTVLLLVPSQLRDAETRNAIRETWGSAAQAQVWPGKPLSLPVSLVFVLGAEEGDKADGKADSSTERELESRDILQFDMLDSYKNLTRKILLGLNWTVSSCPQVQYVVKVDQDIFINIPLLLSFLKHFGKDDRIYGTMYPKGFVHREGKWAVEKEAVPVEFFPSYASGTCYVVARGAAQRLLQLSTRFRYVPIEDAFITGVLASVAGVDRVFVSGFTEWRQAGAKPCEFVNDEKYAAHQMSASDLRNVWRLQVDRGRYANCG